MQIRFIDGTHTDQPFLNAAAAANNVLLVVAKSLLCPGWSVAELATVISPSVRTLVLRWRSRVTKHDQCTGAAVQRVFFF